VGCVPVSLLLCFKTRLSVAFSPLHPLCQTFEKQGFHTGTPAASFNLPSALGSAGQVNPATAAGYPPPFMHILAPHQQQMHSQILHLQQDGQVRPSKLVCQCWPRSIPASL